LTYVQFGVKQQPLTHSRTEYKTTVYSVLLTHIQFGDKQQPLTHTRTEYKTTVYSVLLTHVQFGDKQQPLTQKRKVKQQFTPFCWRMKSFKLNFL